MIDISTKDSKTEQATNSNLDAVISRFFKEMAEKHKVKIHDLNLHISYNQLYIQEYTPNQRSEFKCLEVVDLNGL